MDPDDQTPRAWLAEFIEHHASGTEEGERALEKLAALRDPPTEPPGAGWTTPDTNARRRHG